jgi:hypothetical protein
VPDAQVSVLNVQHFGFAVGVSVQFTQGDKAIGVSAPNHRTAHIEEAYINSP